MSSAGGLPGRDNERQTRLELAIAHHRKARASTSSPAQPSTERPDLLTIATPPITSPPVPQPPTSIEWGAMDKLPPKVRDVIVELEKGLKELYGDRFRGLLLYGSYARGTAWEGSDVDLLLLLRGPVNSVQEILRTDELTASLSLESELVLSVLPFSIEDFEEGKTMFLRNIREDAIPVAA